MASISLKKNAVVLQFPPYVMVSDRVVGTLNTNVVVAVVAA